MRQFYESYRSNQKVSALLRQSPWTHHLLILGQAKPAQAREFYILAAINERYLIAGGLSKDGNWFEVPPEFRVLDGPQAREQMRLLIKEATGGDR